MLSNIGGNELTGTVPSELGAIGTLVALDMGKSIFDRVDK